jgi:hypothetical protein
MHKDEIPRREWSDFFVGFVRTHAGCPCALEVTTCDDGQRIRFTSMLLTSLGADVGDDGARVRVLLTDYDGDQIGYAIAQPRHVLHAAMGAHSDETLEIDAPGTKTTLIFRAAS